MPSAESHHQPPQCGAPDGTLHSTPSALHSLRDRLRYQALWRLAFLLAFFVLPTLVDFSQAQLREVLPPLRQALAAPIALFLFLYSYRLGSELLQTNSPMLRRLVLGAALPAGLAVALCLLVVLGVEGEQWLLRGISLLMVILVARYTIRFLTKPQGNETLLALADLTYLGSVFLAALYRHYHRWTDLAVFLLGDLKGVHFWAPAGAALLFAAGIALQLGARPIDTALPAAEAPQG